MIDEPDEPGGWLMILALLGLMFGGVLALVFAFWFLSFAAQQFHAPVNRTSLVRSVGYATYGGIDRFSRCRNRDGRTWRCDLSEDGGSESSSYRVVVDRDSSCWRAVRITVAGGGPPPKELFGCVVHFEGGWSGHALP